MHQHAAMSLFSGGLLCFALSSCIGLAEPLPSAAHTSHNQLASSQDDNNIQSVSSGGLPIPLSLDGPGTPVVKRAWKQMNGGWGKRAWKQMQGGWGKREYPWQDKRTWQKFQGGWGKRSGWNGDDEWTLNENDNELMPYQYDEYSNGPNGDFDDFNDDEKRAWKSLTPTWGKRASDWESFRGSWGKRDPAWNNLKGLWGKRNMQDRISA